MRNWIFGAVIGICVALVLAIILHYTAFKNKRMTWLYIIFIILFGVAGAVLQTYYFNFDKGNTPTPEDQIKDITSTVEDNWKNTNGGFTFEQIQKSLEDDECPTYDDQIISLNCYDFGGYIVFSFENDGVYQNVLFYKSGNGLILDGMANTTANYKFYGGMFNFKLDTFRWHHELDKEPYYFEETSWFKCNYDNMVSVSRQSAYFVENLEGGFLTFNRGAAVNHALKEAALLTGINATTNFIKFGDVELIGSAFEGYVRINSFYNYLYEQINGQDYNTNKVIDATNSMCVPIPVELQKNYPISSDKKSEYNDADYYGVYKCNIAVDLTYKKGNKTNSASIKNEEYVDTIKNDNDLKDKIIVNPLKPNYSFSSVLITFTNSQDSDLSNVDLSQTPVKVTFTCNELNISKTVVIDSYLKLLLPRVVILNNNQTWNYLIDSEALIFETFRGHFTLSSQKTSLTFPYYYLDNYTIASIGLNPIGTIDSADIDLVANPVRIILSNDAHTYQFEFVNNSELNTYKNMLVELGTYTYTILSKQLVFASVTGNLTITTTDKVMLFNYSLKVDQPLSFSITMTTTSNNAGKIHLSSDASNVTTIRNNLPSNKTYIVSCYIYDADGKLMESFSHTHSVTGSCSDTWSPSNLVNGTEYTAQLRFTSSEDTTVTYLSDICKFTWDSKNGYQLAYTVAKN